MTKSAYWVYILLCENQNYYTGYTSDLNKRYQSHLNGTASKYTRSFKPVMIAQSWGMSSKSSAMRAEAFVKKLSRKDKEKLIRTPAMLTAILPVET